MVFIHLTLTVEQWECPHPPSIFITPQVHLYTMSQPRASTPPPPCRPPPHPPRPRAEDNNTTDTSVHYSFRKLCMHQN